MTRPIAVLDANVLYPARLRDLLVRLAVAGTYQARWSPQILDECFTNILVDRPDLSPEQLERTRSLMATAVPDALVTSHQARVEGLWLPDPDDRHVLAAALVADAHLIVTANLADFPPAALAAHSVEAISPDEHVRRLALDDLDTVVDVVTQQAADLHAPHMTVDELLDGLSAVGLTRTVAILRAARR